jgi:hypothetical protein
LSLKQGRLLQTLLGIGVFGIGTLLLAYPALNEALQIYMERRLMNPGTASISSSQARMYFDIPWKGIPILVAQPWLLIVGAVMGLYGLLKGNRLIIVNLLWAGGSLYLLDLPLLAFTNMGAVFIMLYLPLGIIIGAGSELWARKLVTYWPKLTPKALTIMVLILTVLFIPIRLKAIEPYRHFVTPSDIRAMEWITKHIPEKTVFAINTVFWLPHFPHGTDAGYWIPYFAGRRTTTETMLFSLGTDKYRAKIVGLSKLVERLESDCTALEELRRWGVEYIYFGRKGDYAGPGLQFNWLRQLPGVTLLYHEDEVSIFRISS